MVKRNFKVSVDRVQDLKADILALFIAIQPKDQISASFDLLLQMFEETEIRCRLFLDDLRIKQLLVNNNSIS